MNVHHIAFSNYLCIEEKKWENNFYEPCLFWVSFFFFWKTGYMCYKSRIMIHGIDILYDRYFLRLEMIAVKTLKGIISYKVLYWQKYIALTSLRVMKMINTMYICSQSVTNLRNIFDFPSTILWDIYFRRSDNLKKMDYQCR